MSATLLNEYGMVWYAAQQVVQRIHNKSNIGRELYGRPNVQ